VRYVGERLTYPLDSMHAADLHLACACIDGDPAAIAVFDAEYLEDASRVLRARRSWPGDSLDEARARVRMQLLVGDAGLAGYSGRGPLRAWLQVTLGREAARLAQRGQREATTDPVELVDLPAAHDDPELEHLKRRYGDDFRASFQEALAGLGERTVQILRWSYVEGLSIDEIGVLLRVHRSSAHRYLAAARQQLVDATRDAMQARLRINTGELKSVLRVIESQVHVSVIRLLGG
jgi:RNA polymerase sigma-70 factor (ECF subfamily)